MGVVGALKGAVRCCEGAQGACCEGVKGTVRAFSVL